MYYEQAILVQLKNSELVFVLQHIMCVCVCVCVYIEREREMAHRVNDESNDRAL